MSVNISRLWKDTWFQNQHNLTKLLYVYLATNPSISILGVFSLNLDVACIELGCSKDSLRSSAMALVQRKLIYVKEFEKVVYFIISAHFNTIPKSESSVAKVNKELKSLPEGLVAFLESVGISINSKVREFKRPTPEEVVAYSLTLGHLISGDAFISYYDEQSDRYGKKGVWVDGRGTEVRDWKAKLRKIWLKDENKIKTFDDAPKGYESFHIVDNLTLLVPDGWRGGKPWAKSLTTDIILKREYERRKGSS